MSQSEGNCLVPTVAVLGVAERLDNISSEYLYIDMQAHHFSLL